MTFRHSNKSFNSKMKLPAVDFIKENIPLAEYTFYRIGGPARFAFFPTTLQQITWAYEWVKGHQIPLLVIGSGSNVLISDAGFPGAVFFTTELKTLAPLGNHCYRCGAGTTLASIVENIMLANNYAGVGALTGIPGTLGGALFMNAGTVNGSICQFTKNVVLIGDAGLEEVEIRPELYAYRRQFFCEPETVIVEAELTFSPSNQDETAIYNHYIKRRLDTQPQGWCCGSVFKNPEGNHAGHLIEACGLKGTRIGGALISEKHANFIMNEGNASFKDVLSLIHLAKSRVRERFGIELEEEVRIIQ